MHKRMGRLLCGLLLLMLISLTACVEQQTPSEQVAAEFDKIREEEIESDLDTIFGSSALASQYEEQYRELLGKMKEFDYEITGEEISEDEKTAVVKVDLTTYDFGSAYQATYEKIIEDAEAGDITIETDLETYIYDTMFSEMLALKDKAYHKSIDISCGVNDSGDWIPEIHDNEEVLDALLGGVMTVSEERARGA